MNNIYNHLSNDFSESLDKQFKTKNTIYYKKSQFNEQLNQEDTIDSSISRQKPFITRKFKTGDDPRAISYGPYRHGQAPNAKGPSKKQILEDLNIIKEHWKLIRVYGSDADSQRILQVIDKHNLPLKVLLGVWLENEIDQPQRKALNQNQVKNAIEMANRYEDLVAAVSVGNETQVFWSYHRMAAENLIKYIRKVRNNTSVPVTTADDYNFWNKAESKSIATEIDFIVAHIYPLWNGKPLESAIDWTDHTFHKSVEKMHPGKQIVIGEIGWATNYNQDKKGPGQQGSLINAEVSVRAQESFLIKLDQWIEKTNLVTFLFEAFDEPWKGGGKSTSSKEVEKNWGVFYEDRTPKESFLNYLKYKNNR